MRCGESSDIATRERVITYHVWLTRPRTWRNPPCVFRVGASLSRSQRAQAVNAYRHDINRMRNG